MEPLAGLARAALVHHDPDTALQHIKSILDYLEDNQLTGCMYPFLVHLSCVQVLEAAGDPRADEVLVWAHTLLQEQAAKIPEGGMREKFLAIPAHQELLRLWKAAKS